MACFNNGGTQGSGVRPGPCRGACPPPTRIECIETTKVYDFCFQLERVTERVNLVPCIDGAIQPTDVLRCKVDTDDITVDITNVDRTGLDNGFARVTFTVGIPVKIKVFTPSGDLRCDNPFCITFFITKTILICFPEGVDLILHTTGRNLFRCTCVLTMMGSTPVAACTLEACLLIQSAACVKLLVPSYGFCTPTACREEVAGICPPEAIFPPQCDGPIGGSGCGS